MSSRSRRSTIDAMLSKQPLRRHGHAQVLVCIKWPARDKQENDLEDLRLTMEKQTKDQYIAMHS